MTKQNHQCPKCQSYKTSSLALISFIFGTILAFFIITFPIGLLFWFGAIYLYFKPKYLCMDCHYKFD